MVLALGLGVPHACGESESRVWTSASGFTLEATLVDTDGVTVRLKKADGNIVTVKTADLAEADRAYLAAAKRGATTPPAPVAPAAVAKDSTQLPVFPDGEAKGLHAIYKSGKYLARVNQGGFVTVTPVEGGRENANLTIRILPDAYTEENGGRKQYWIRKFTRSGQPQTNPAAVTFTGVRDGGITCEVEYRFSEDAITTWFRAEESGSSPAGLVHRMRHEFVPSKTPLNGTAPADFKAFWKQVRAEWKDRSGKKNKAAFFDSATMRGNLEELSVAGASLGRCRIVMDGPRDKECVMMPYQYSGMTLSEGFTVYLVKKTPGSSDRKNEAIRISFR